MMVRNLSSHSIRMACLLDLEDLISFNNRSNVICVYVFIIIGMSEALLERMYLHYKLALRLNEPGVLLLQKIGYKCIVKSIPKFKTKLQQLEVVTIS